MECIFVCIYVVYCVKFYLTFNIIANIENDVAIYCLKPCEQKSTIIYSASLRQNLDAYLLVRERDSYIHAYTA